MLMDDSLHIRRLRGRGNQPYLFSDTHILMHGPLQNENLFNDNFFFYFLYSEKSHAE